MRAFLDLADAKAALHFALHGRHGIWPAGKSMHGFVLFAYDTQGQFTNDDGTFRVRDALEAYGVGT